MGSPKWFAILQSRTEFRRKTAEHILAFPDSIASILMPFQSHSLIPFLTNIKYLKKAARQCMRRASSPGADGITWKRYRQSFQQNLTLLSQRLKAGTWEPNPTRHIKAKLFTGKEILIAIPTVEDRIVHRAMRNSIEPILESQAFLDFVFGFRPGRSRLMAVRKAMHFFADRQTLVADIDVAKVSEGVTVEDVCNWLANWISDGSFLHLFRKALLGLPIPICPGSGLSPLLINLRLVPVDWKLRHLKIIRFSDNYCAFCASQNEAEEAFDRITESLQHNGLVPASTKSSIRFNANPEDLFLIAG